MKKTILIAMGFLSFLFGSCSKQSSERSATPGQESKFRAGQVWAFKTPAAQPNARLVILRVENDSKLGTIIHIAVTGVSYGKGQDTIRHLPFAERAIEQSVTKLQHESGPIPDFAEGYQTWREAFDAGKAGIFTITVAEACDAVIGIARDHN
jgi:hypothetical protein